MRQISSPTRTVVIGLLTLVTVVAGRPREAQAGAAERLRLTTRSRAETAQGSGEWQPVEKTVDWEPRKTAVVICDMWDRHWCQDATRRVAEMAPRMNAVVKTARERGVLIIHCPSDTMKFYEGTPQRKLAQAAPRAEPRVSLQGWCGLDRRKEPALPIDDADGGCDDSPQCNSSPPYPWTRQIAAIEIREGDAITDSAEAYYLMQQRGIDNVIVMGVHLNMCVLGRPFSIRQMVNQGKHVLLMRDLTDTMYNSRRPPQVPHGVGTALMIEHVEKFWCPTIASTAFVGDEEFRFKEDKQPRVLFLIGDPEYRTGETVPEWAKKELAWRGVRCTFVTEDPHAKASFSGLAALPEADALFVSIKRSALPRDQMALIKHHLAAGKPIVGIRTASHAFGAKPADDQHIGWDSFDRDIFGGWYQGHYGKGNGPLVRPLPGAAAHPILAGMPTNEIRFVSHLYKCRELAPTTMTVWQGRLAGQEVTEPVAWVNTNAQRRAFYTALGSPEDFTEPAFRRLLRNAVLWALSRPVPR
jgi:nicotinamidase-related amidase/type 1 glutamine amidotransferase